VRATWQVRPCLFNYAGPSCFTLWFQKVTAYFQIQETPVSAQIAALAPDVDVPHADPCDRIIVATATTRDFAIVTSDKLIRQCSQVNVIW